MKYMMLIWAGLRRKPARTILTFLSIACAFLLYGGLHGVTAGFDVLLSQTSDTRLNIQNGRNIILGLPASHAVKIKEVPGVRTVAYFQPVPAYYREPKNMIALGAVGFADFLEASPRVLLPPEQREAMLRTRSGAVVGHDIAQRFGWKVGDRVHLNSAIPGGRNWEFEIVGIYTIANNEYGSTDFLMNFEYLEQGRVQSKGRIMMFFVRVNEAKRATAISEEIDALFANSMNETLTQPEREWMIAQGNQLGDIRFLVRSIISAVLFTILFVTATAMKQSFRERVPELAVLKTYGYSSPMLIALIIAESLMLCLSAAAAGLLIAVAIFPGIYLQILGASYAVAPIVWMLGLVVAVGLGIASALPPAWRASRLSVVDGLAGR